MMGAWKCRRCVNMMDIKALLMDGSGGGMRTERVNADLLMHRSVWFL